MALGAAWALWACEAGGGAGGADQAVSLDLAVHDGAPPAQDAQPTDAQSQDARTQDAGWIIDGQVEDAGPTDAEVPLDADVDAQLDEGLAQDAAPPDAEADAQLPIPQSLRINEAMADNEGAWVDALGELDDWVELYNPTDSPIDLSAYAISDRLDEAHPLPAWTLPPKGYVVLTADGTPEQGEGHLPFRLSKGGESLYLWHGDGVLIDTFELGPSRPNEAWQRRPDGADVEPSVCRYASPGQTNGARCGPLPLAERPVRDYAPYTFSDPWPQPAWPLTITELALKPAAGEAGFVEVVNRGDAPLDLSALELRLAAQAPGEPWPIAQAGVRLDWPQPALAVGARLQVPASAQALAVVRDAPEDEAVLSLWRSGQDWPLDRVDFMAWPRGATLARPEGDVGPWRFCAEATPGLPNTRCAPLESRPVPGRLRHVRTPGDFAALAEGGQEQGIAPVKFLIDLAAGDVVHLLGTERWDLHYRFVREVIDGQSVLDRCDPQEAALFDQGWRLFGEENYEQAQGRRFLMGTLVKYAGNGLQTLEFAAGDRLSAAQMRRAYFATVAHVPQPAQWAARPLDAHQQDLAESLEGQLPLVDVNAPFAGLRFQPLTEAVGYGVLRFVPVDELEQTPLGPQVLLVTDDVPNDIPLVGGLITEAFQTPLAHVNLLSRNRNTPNMALRDARHDARLAPYFDQLVRLEVAQDGFTIRPAAPQEAADWWAQQQAHTQLLVPRLDTTVGGLVALEGADLDALPSIGAKAAGLAELMRVWSVWTACPGRLPTPHRPVAVPFSWERAHFEASGARALLAQLEADPSFQGDPIARAAGLRRVQSRILVHPVAPALLDLVTAHMREAYGEAASVRFRSSSNTEDLPGFNGAGLYHSVSAGLSAGARSPADALRTVWASLWNARAYDERTWFGVDHHEAAMAVLIHPAFPSELLNGVGISRDLTDPIRADHYYNQQIGEASVTNPAPGVTSEQLIWRLQRLPRMEVRSHSSLNGGQPVQSEAEMVELACSLRALHDHFQARIDPEGLNPWFAMDIEYKRLPPDRRLLIKQARPYSFGAVQPPADCRTL